MTDGFTWQGHTHGDESRQPCRLAGVRRICCDQYRGDQGYYAADPHVPAGPLPSQHRQQGRQNTRCLQRNPESVSRGHSRV